MTRQIVTDPFKRRFSNKEVHLLVRLALHAGCSLLQGSKHDRLRSPDGTKYASIPGSPRGDGRAVARLRSTLRQWGIEV